MRPARHTTARHRNGRRIVDACCTRRAHVLPVDLRPRRQQLRLRRVPRRSQSRVRADLGEQCVPGATPFDMSLTPASATNPVGTNHTVTATLTQGGVALSGETVQFSVTGANGPGGGTATTNSLGKATFTYTGTAKGPQHRRVFRRDKRRDLRRDRKRDGRRGLPRARSSRRSLTRPTRSLPAATCSTP